jgi:hypothetical protein
VTTRRLPEVACLFLIVLALTLAAAAPARAGDDPDSTTTTAFDDGEQRIIPRPNSGHEPDEAGDRGGALQLAVLGLVVVGVGVVGFNVFRKTRQSA